MRHNKKFNHLGRTKSHRDALLANMTCSLIMHKRIITTLAKAKALRIYAEPLINRAKTDDTANRRVVFRYLQNKEAVTELFQNISQKIADRPGGYTRILKLGNRLGDNAKTCFIELVDYNENMLKTAKDAKKAIINIDTISNAYEAGEVVDLASLKEKGLVDKRAKSLKILARGSINKPLTIKAGEFSNTAIKMIVLTGGTAVHVSYKVK